MPKHLKKLTVLCLAAGFILASSFTYAEKQKHPIDTDTEACLDKDSSTAGMITCLDEAIKSWDAELNRVYKALQSELNANAQKELKEAQRQWIKYRDAEFEAIGALYRSIYETMGGGTMWRTWAVGAKEENDKQLV